MNASSRPVFALILTTVLALAGCGGAAAPATSKPAAQAGAPAVWEQIVAAAKQEGTAILGVPPGPQYQPAIAEGFGKAYPGIKLEMTNIHAADFSTRLANERAAGLFAWYAWIGGPDVDIYRLASEGAFDPLKPDITQPDVLDNSKWLGGGFDVEFSDQAKKFTLNFGALSSEGAFVNRYLIPESALAKYEDLWKPEFKGKIVWQDPRQSGSGVNSAAVILKVFGEQKLRDLWSSQGIVLSTDERQMAEWVARGTHPIGIGLVRNRGIDLLKAQGVGLSIKSVPFPIALNIPGAHALIAVNKPPHPNARKVILTWILSQDGQTAIAKASNINSRRLDVPIVDPTTVPPKDQPTLNTQAEDFAPL